MNKKLIFVLSIFLIVISISSVSAADNSTVLTSSDDDVLQDNGDVTDQYVKTKIVADSIIGEDGDSIYVPIEVLDENDNPVMNGTATLVIGEVLYTSEVKNGSAVFESVLIQEGMTKATFGYMGNEYYDSCDLEVIIYVVHETYPDIPIGDSPDISNATVIQSQPSSVKAITDSKATGNPILAILLSLMIVSSMSIINRKR
ncbi:hypothetical protein [uncultured Methanobrevibacter sp.]|uniref:hypothetical protein n=1 Tax=uncultured Methanobrevibacter sp. TaxID=253161 RepID=UPI0026052909|nr:hypothetical protein [uncultured Methanobrevibacter sp.]